MARGLGDGLLRLCNGAWRDNDGDAVDIVEVVRCKGCKYFVQGEPYDPCECMKWMVKFGVAYTTPGWLLPQGGKERQWVKNHGLCDC